MCLGAVPAHAADWSLISTLSESLEANDNPFLRAVAGGAFNSYSTIAASAVARTPIYKFTFDGDVNYRKYWGPGTAGTQSESLSGDAKLHYEAYGKNTADRTYLDASWNRQSTAFALLGQLGVVTNTRGFIDVSSVSGGIDRAITYLDTVSLSARASYTSYDPGTIGTTFIDAGANGIWRHRVNSLSTVSASSDVEQLHFNNALNTEIMILRENLGLDTALTPPSFLQRNGRFGLCSNQQRHTRPFGAAIQ